MFRQTFEARIEHFNDDPEGWERRLDRLPLARFEDREEGNKYMWSSNIFEIIGFLMSLRFKGTRWRMPSESKESSECAIVEVYLDVPVESSRAWEILLAIVTKWVAGADTDHPIFQYLKTEQVSGRTAGLTLTLSLKERKD